MTKIFTLSLFLLFSLTGVKSQSTYYSSNYASSGDTFNITGANIDTLNFDTTGTGITWDYATLTGNSQKKLIHRLPTQTGVSTLPWFLAYGIFNYYANTNVNLSSTDGSTIAIGTIQQTNPNDYLLKTDAYLRVKGTSFNLSLNGLTYPVVTNYTKPDTLYRYPLTYNSTNRSTASYTLSVPTLIYRKVELNRRDTVNGWGTLITPYGTFANCLKYVSNVTEIDSLSILDTPILSFDTIRYREIKWFSPLKKYQLLTVRQILIGGIYVTQSIEYLDSLRYFKPTALFVFNPPFPNAGDTVQFQNLSLNGLTYKWYFSDASSGTGNLDSSTSINPQHIFHNPGTYPVMLVAFNGPLSDTIIIDVIVNPVNSTYTFIGDGNWDIASNWLNNKIPPLTLTTSNSIVIDPVANGSCKLTVVQQILTGASITVNAGKTFIIPDYLRLR